MENVKLNPQSFISVPPSVSEADFRFFRAALGHRAGIKLADSKKDLLQSRLRPRLQTLGLVEFSQYRVLLESLEDSDTEWQEFINCLTTNKTDWFREPRHFEFLISTLIPKWNRQSERAIKIWSAASSTGEEPYSLSACLTEHLNGPSFNLLATDIDTEVLRYAKSGVYPYSKLVSIPEGLPTDFFIRGRDGIENWAKIRNQIKAPVRFEPFNLLSDTPPEENAFDLIFCRNVLIYFPKETIAKVITTLYKSARPGGTLIIGHSESLQGIKHPWKMIRPSIFVK